MLFTARYQLKNLVAAGALQEPAEEAVYRFSLRGLGRPGEEPLAEGPWEFSITSAPRPAAGTCRWTEFRTAGRETRRRCCGSPR